MVSHEPAIITLFNEDTKHFWLHEIDEDDSNFNGMDSHDSSNHRHLNSIQSKVQVSQLNQQVLENFKGLTGFSSVYRPSGTM